MKHLLVTLGIVAFLAALPLSHLAMAVPSCDDEKVLICHVNSANDVIEFDTVGEIVFGIVIEVDWSAVPAHLEEHGDSLCPFERITKEEREEFEEEYGISLPNADCYFYVTEDGCAG